MAEHAIRMAKFGHILRTTSVRLGQESYTVGIIVCFYVPSMIYVSGVGHGTKDHDMPRSLISKFCLRPSTQPLSQFAGRLLCPWNHHESLQVLHLALVSLNPYKLTTP